MSWTGRPRLGVAQFVAVAACLGLVLLLAVSIMWSDIMEQYYLTVVAPPLEREFGYQAAYVGVRDRWGGGRGLQLTLLSSGGRLEAAGFQVGDMLGGGVCQFYGEYRTVEFFVESLEKVAAGETVEFGVARKDPNGYRFRRLTVRPAKAVPATTPR